jgi:pimeloyl-ACP methyl ester carboxylesterase
MFFTTKETLASHLVAGIEYVTSKHGTQPVLFGHSAGGLAQATLNLGLARVHALGLIDAFPNYGGFWVYVNWFFKLDPWSLPRVLKDFFHTRSPLSTTELVHSAFFSKPFPTDEVRKFERDMPEYESMMWPSQMMGRFVNVAKVKTATEAGKVVIVSGDEDRLMMRDLMERMAGEYEAPIIKVRGGHNVMRYQYWEETANTLLQWVQNLDK